MPILCFLLVAAITASVPSIRATPLPRIRWAIVLAPGAAPLGWRAATAVRA